MRRADKAKHPEKFKKQECLRWAENKEREKARFAKWYAINKVGEAEKSRKWYSENVESVKLRDALRYEKDPENLKQMSRNWKQQNRSAARAKSLEWQRNNPDRARVNASARRAVSEAATPSWAEKFFMEEAYALARLRTKITGIKWNVDHIVPLVSEKVCGLHAHTNLAVITAAENFRKQNHYWPDMP